MNESTLPTVGDWAREVVPTDAGTDHAGRTSTGADRRLSTVLATAMVVAPLAMTAWFLVEPSVLPREDADVFLASVASSPARYLAGTLLVALSGLAGMVAAFGLARVLGRRLPRLGRVVGVLTFLSGAGLLVQVGFRSFVWSLVDASSVPAASVESYHRFQTGGLFDVLVAPGLVFGGLATLLTVGALVRTRMVPLWVPGAMVVGLVLASGEFADPVTVGGAAVGAAANLRLARELFTRA
ncbi:MAG TPA: DUF4386 family protein [Nocardioides sp.]|nr:DUF4386 family protein [Nocardioides sp.]